MQTHEVVAVVAAVLALLGAVPYVIDTLRGRTRPNRATWTVYAVVGTLAVISSYAAGGRWSLLVGVAYAIGPVAILLASIRHGEGGWSPLDRSCLGLAALGLAGWAVSGDPRVGVVLHTLAAQPAPCRPGSRGGAIRGTRTAGPGRSTPSPRP